MAWETGKEARKLREMWVVQTRITQARETEEMEIQSCLVSNPSEVFVASSPTELTPHLELLFAACFPHQPGSAISSEVSIHGWLLMVRVGEEGSVCDKQWH